MSTKYPPITSQDYTPRMPVIGKLDEKMRQLLHKVEIAEKNPNFSFLSAAMAMYTKSFDAKWPVPAERITATGKKRIRVGETRDNAYTGRLRGLADGRTAETSEKEFTLLIAGLDHYRSYTQETACISREEVGDLIAAAQTTRAALFPASALKIGGDYKQSLQEILDHFDRRGISSKAIVAADGQFPRFSESDLGTQYYAQKPAPAKFAAIIHALETFAAPTNARALLPEHIEALIAAYGTTREALKTPLPQASSPQPVVGPYTEKFSQSGTGKTQRVAG